MKTGLDKKFLARVERKANNGEVVRRLRALERMNKMEPIEWHENDIGLSSEHPYWREDFDLRKRALGVIEGQLRLLEKIWPEKFRRGKERGKGVKDD